MVLLVVALGFALILPLQQRRLQLSHDSTLTKTTIFSIWLATYAIISHSVSTRRCQLADAADRLV